MASTENSTGQGWKPIRIIGRGNYGMVYEIRQTTADGIESGALKVVSVPQNAGEIEEMRSSGYDEARITEVLRGRVESIVNEYSTIRKMNGSILACYDVNYAQHDSGIGWDIFIRTELLPSLIKVLPSDVLEETAVRLAVDLCVALEHCARHHIVHGDIKPHNIFVSENGDYKLGDFSIAKTLRRTSGGTGAQACSFMAPEVYKDQPYDQGADIYSLGMVLYWMLNERRLPFESEVTDYEEKAGRDRRMSGEAIPAPAHGSEALKKIVLKACAYNPGDRYASASEMLKDLLELMKGSNRETGQANAAGKAPADQAAPDPKPQPPKKRKAPIALAAVLVLCLAAFLLWPKDTDKAPKGEQLSVAEPQKNPTSATEPENKQEIPSDNSAKPVPFSDYSFDKVGEKIRYTGIEGAAWSTNAPDVIKVSSNGVITALSGGEAEVYADLGTETRTCVVTVNTYVPSEEERRTAEDLLKAVEDYEAQHETYTFAELQAMYDAFIEQGNKVYTYSSATISSTPDATVVFDNENWYNEFTVYYYASDTLVYKDAYLVVTNGDIDPSEPTYSNWVTVEVYNQLYTVNTQKSEYYCFHEADSSNPWEFYGTEYADGAATRTIIPYVES